MSYYQFLRNSTYWRYGIFIVTLFLGLYTMQAWTNYKSIQDSIVQEKQKILDIQEEIDYMQRRYQNYLHSEYATYFLGHENGQLYQGERLVYLEYRKPNEQKVKEASIEIIPTDEPLPVNKTTVSPEEARQFFFAEKLPLLQRYVDRDSP